jgi:transcriptional regulator with XRE-family HTH domain
MKKKSDAAVNPLVNQRIKQIRKSLQLSQMQFSRIISLSSGYLAGVEVGKRKVNERLIKLICSSFNANDCWLKNGEGEMFRQHPDESLTKLVNLYKELVSKYRHYILKEINLLLEIQDQESGDP